MKTMIRIVCMLTLALSAAGCVRVVAAPRIPLMKPGAMQQAIIPPEGMSLKEAPEELKELPAIK